MSRYCEGFYFTYYVADKHGRRRSVQPDAHFLAAENEVLRRVRLMLLNRPDWLEELMCMDNALEVHLYKGNQFREFKDDVYFYGRTTLDGDVAIMEFATEEVLYGAREGHHVLDVVMHEITHVIDFFDNKDGVLPDWSATDIVLYESARRLEVTKIRNGTSPMDAYALSNHKEFLAVLVETFFYKPTELQESNPILYGLMETFFQQDPSVDFLETRRGA